MSKERFAHLHVHSDMSLLTGCATMRQYASVAQERGHKGIAFTEYGTLRGVSEFIGIAKEHNLIPVFGIEFHICGDMNRRGITPDEKASITAELPRSRWKAAIAEYEDQHGIHERHLLTVWAVSNQGLNNLFKLSSRSWNDGFYYKPRIDLGALIEMRDGLVVGTGGADSVIHFHAQHGRRKKALETADRLWEAFGPDHIRLELMPHAVYNQALANKFTLELRKRWGKQAQLLATQDAHYVAQGDHVYQRMLSAIGSRDRPLDECGLPGEDYWFKTRDEMMAGFAHYHSAIGAKTVKRALDGTVRFVDAVDTTLGVDRFQCIIPAVHVPSDHGGDEYQYLVQLCQDGWVWRDIPKRVTAYARHHKITVDEAQQLYWARLKRELKALKHQNFVTYILYVRELYDWVRSQDIACGPGRGSAAGSIVNFLIGITSVDPVEHGLLFERFISPQRIDMPDIDCDFEDVRRGEIIQHLKDKYGWDCAAQIATVGKLTGKACLRDISRVLKVPPSEIGSVTKALLERSSGDERASMTIEDSFKEIGVCRDFDVKYPKVLEYARHIEGKAKTLGIHAAGVVCAPKPLEEILPLESRDHGGQRIPVTAVDFWGAEGFGLLKLDVLGLRTMTVLRRAADEVKRRHGVEIDYEILPLNDADVLQGFTDHDYCGIFQYDSPGADKICSGVDFTHFEDVAAMTALNRPGTARSGLAGQYVARKKNPKLVAKASYHPAVSAITRDTLGIIVYQEHVIKIFTEIAGFEPGTADSLRKKIAKKMGDETLGKEREKFIKGAVSNTGMTKKMAGKIMDAITFFGSYGFNKSHATAYGMIAYWGMYIKIHYPLEFFQALLYCEPNLQRIQAIAKDAKAHGVDILPPDVSVSGEGFTIDDKLVAIRGSLSDIKGVGKAAAGAIMAQQPFKTLWDFMDRVERRKVNKRVVHALALAGALDGLLPNPKWFVDHMDTIWEMKDKKGKLEALKALIERSAKVPGYDDEERVLVASRVSPLAFGKHPIDAYGEFIERYVKVPLEPMGADDFWERLDASKTAGFWICGIIIEIRLNQVGDFHSGEHPPEDEKRRMKWGAQYANINVEGADGKQHRVKFDWDIFETYRHIIIDRGKGTPIIAHVSGNKRFENLRAHFCVDLEELRKLTIAKTKLDLWQRAIVGRHPANEYQFKSQKLKQLAGESIHKIRRRAKRAASKAGRGEVIVFRVVGVITHVREKLDKKMKMMGFFGILGVEGYIDALCFGSMWPQVRKAIQPGRLIEVELEYNGGQGIYSGDMLRCLK